MPFSNNIIHTDTAAKILFFSSLFPFFNLKLFYPPVLLCFFAGANLSW